LQKIDGRDSIEASDGSPSDRSRLTSSKNLVKSGSVRSNDVRTLGRDHGNSESSNGSNNGLHFYKEREEEKGKEKGKRLEKNQFAALFIHFFCLRRSGRECYTFAIIFDPRIGLYASKKKKKEITQEFTN
jgi:hypothetical protein